MREFPHAIMLSARREDDIVMLRQAVLDFFDESMVDAELRVPYAKQNLVSEVYQGARVLSEEYDESGAMLRVRAHAPTIARLRSLIDR
ncbi:MAG: hypothetical protein NVS3B20_23000 [Polyangiales bacterium]